MGLDITKRITAKMTKKMINAYVKSCFFMKNYKDIQHAGEMINKYIDKDNKESFEYWCSQLNFESRVKSKIDMGTSEEAKKWKKGDENRRGKFIQKIESKSGIKIKR